MFRLSALRDEGGINIMDKKSSLKLFYTDHKMVIIHNKEEWLAIESNNFYLEVLNYFKRIRLDNLAKHEHALKVLAFGGAYVLSDIAESTAANILKGINNGSLNLNRHTPYDFGRADIPLVLEGIFECIHNNSLSSLGRGRIDVDARQIYGKNDLMISIKIFEPQGSFAKIFGGQPKIKKEYVIESADIIRVYGSSVEINMELKKSPYQLKIAV